MEVHYKREMKHNYLIVEPDEGNKPDMRRGCC